MLTQEGGPTGSEQPPLQDSPNSTAGGGGEVVANVLSPQGAWRGQVADLKRRPQDEVSDGAGLSSSKSPPDPEILGLYALEHDTWPGEFSSGSMIKFARS